MLNESVKPASALTEEELMHREIRFNSDLMGSIMTPTSYRYTEEIIKSHRTLNSRNAKLIHENDELMAENVKLKRGMFAAYDSIFCEMSVPKHLREKFYRILIIDCKLDPNIRALEELKHE